ncbi:MAG: hypothetical protein J7L23_05110 [Candidatus Diapherotrites archaeon]|nr:hypothetical protein [Candidatus Diapherotrites archaeon]
MKLSKSMFIVALFLLLVPVVFSQEASCGNKTVCGVYFTGIGCPHCARADPVVLEDTIQEHPELIVIEYEIYQWGMNAPLMYYYDSYYNSGFGIPNILFSKDKKIVGDYPIIQTVGNMVNELKYNPCPLENGSSVDFSSLNITQLPGHPKIWAHNKVLIWSGGNGNDSLLRNLMLCDEPASILKGVNHSEVAVEPVPLSGGSVSFEHAVKVGGWILEWNGNPISHGGECGCNSENQTGLGGWFSGPEVPSAGAGLTLPKIISLAAVDAVNPCALAVLTLMLLAILSYNPKDKKRVLLAGFAFTFSVFVTYIFYGLVIIKSFQLVQALTSFRLILYKLLGAGAFLLGLLNLKDFIWYKPGGLFTEMPLSLRPTVKKLINGITSPKGALVVGFFVTVFLLPCTIGPYVIAGGILSAIGLVETLPWLLLYNLVFVLPMVVVTLIVYAGFTTVKDVSGWKDKNIRYLHLVEGAIMAGLGLAMFMGWI